MRKNPRFAFKDFWLLSRVLATLACTKPENANLARSGKPVALFESKKGPHCYIWPMIQTTLNRYETAHDSFLRDQVRHESDEKLLEHLYGLSNQNNTNQGTQHRDIIRGLTINTILLQRHLDRLQDHIGLLNRQNSNTQKLVIALTVASLIGTVAQVWYAYRADNKPDKEVTQVEAKPSVQAVTPVAKASVAGK